MAGMISRRGFLKGAGVGAAAFVSGCAGGGRFFPGSADRPNFVIVISDDHGVNESGCYGNSFVHTPEIDRLACEGMRFTNAFTGTAMCTPSRSTFYTGLYPVRHGAYPNHSRAYKGIKSVAQYLRELGYRVGLVGKSHVRPFDVFAFDYLGKRRRPDVIEGYLRKVKGEPFCLFIATNNPHTPWLRGGRHDPHKAAVPPYLVDTAETRDAFAGYCNDISLVDREVGFYDGLLKKHGLLENTLFIYVSDQGSGFPHCKWTCYDMGLKVPFIARWPGRIKAGSVSEAMVHFVDFVPTLIELAGGRPQRGLDGKSFLPVLTGEAEEHHEFVYGIHTTQGIIDGNRCYPVRSVRSRTHKLILNLNHEAEFHNVLTEQDRQHYWRSWVKKTETDSRAARLVRQYQHRPAEELYDIRVDPFELDNIADKAENRELKTRMRENLKGWMAMQDDEGIETELEAGSRKKSKRV